jgi:murein DD-endopeptidase MepM/ murein hydrolase activator NlpD
MYEPYGYVSPDRKKLSPELEKARLPAFAPSISQGYKPDQDTDPFQGARENRKTGVHEGIDIVANVGYPVLAAADGVIAKAYYEPLYGNRLVLDHGEIEDGRYMLTRYFHLDERLVTEGDIVKRGQQIATMGRTGLLSGGFAHLHFEVRYRNKPEQRLTTHINPHTVWHDGLGEVTCFDKNADYTSYLFKTTYPVPCEGVEWK